MKKAVLFLACACLTISLAACSAGDETGAWDWKSEPKAEDTNVTLNVFNWGEYIDDSVVRVNDAFTHLTGIKVNYKTYAENETMYTLIKSGTDYDIVFPSDYMVGKMIAEGMLAKINFDNVPNFQYIDDSFKNPDYDPKNEYSVPYTWGTVGIFYNSKYVEEEDLKDGWDLLWNEKYKNKIFMFDNPRDAFGIALKKLGYSMNSTEPAEWQAAYEELLRQKPLVQQYVMDQVYEKMINEEGWIAPYYSGDGIIMMDEEEGNTAIKYFVPEDGTNRFVDAVCITAGTTHKDQAEAYINFLCRTEVALANAEAIGYSTPHTEARKLLDPAIGENEIFYPSDDVLKNTEVFLTLPESINKLENELWNKLKS